MHVSPLALILIAKLLQVFILSALSFVHNGQGLATENAAIKLFVRLL